MCWFGHGSGAAQRVGASRSYAWSTVVRQSARSYESGARPNLASLTTARGSDLLHVIRRRFPAAGHRVVHRIGRHQHAHRRIRAVLRLRVAPIQILGAISHFFQHKRSHTVGGRASDLWCFKSRRNRDNRTSSGLTLWTSLAAGPPLSDMKSASRGEESAASPPPFFDFLLIESCHQTSHLRTNHQITRTARY